jgi:uncharacterized protein (DUF1330 family)
VGKFDMLKNIISVVLAIAFCVPTGVFAQTEPPNQTPAQTSVSSNPLPGYLLVVGKTTDRAKIGNYAASLPPIYAQHNAYYLAVGGAGRGVNWLEGPWSDRSLIFGKFPSRSEVDAFWWGEPYRSAIRKRDGAGVFSVVALSGIVPTPYEGSNTGYVIVMTGPSDSSARQSLASQAAAKAFGDSVLASGGALLTSSEAGAFTALEGDSVFNRFIIAAWPSLAARDAYLASRAARRVARLRAALGYHVAVSANGVARTQAPPAARP